MPALNSFSWEAMYFVHPPLLSYLKTLLVRILQVMDVDVGKNAIDKLIFFSGQTVCSVRTKINLESRTINLLRSDFIRYRNLPKI